MVYILGASSLDHALRKRPAPSQKRVRDTCFTKPGLSLPFNDRDSQKTIHFYLHHFLSHRNDLILWYDAINNSISRHRSNKTRKLSNEQFANLLLSYRTNKCAIVYCRRNGTEDIEESLVSTGISRWRWCWRWRWSLCWRLDDMILTFSLTVSDAMAAAHSWSFLVTSLSNNPPSIHITCGVTCTDLSSNERLFMFIRESSCWTRFERSNRSKGIGSSLDGTELRI